MSEAVAGLRDGASIMISGFGEAGVPHELIEAVIAQGASDLTIISNNAGTGEAGIAALIIGNEGNGVPEAIAAEADAALTIPCPGPVESLNAAVAASILLYEASRQRAPKKGGRR